MDGDLLCDLMDSQLGLRPVTTLRFFTPTQAFWEAMNRYRDKIVVEFGAGRGDTVTEARQHGFRWSGCDLQHVGVTGVMNGVHTFNALRFPLATEMVIIACRPDHSGWCEPALQRAINFGCTAIYVGLERNAERDLGDLYYEHTHLYENVGQEGECMWVFET